MHSAISKLVGLEGLEMGSILSILHVELGCVEHMAGGEVGLCSLLSGMLESLFSYNGDIGATLEATQLVN